MDINKEDGPKIIWPLVSKQSKSITEGGKVCKKIVKAMLRNFPHNGGNILARTKDFKISNGDVNNGQFDNWTHVHQLK